MSQRFGDDNTIAPTAMYAGLAMTPVFGVIGFLLADLLAIPGNWTIPFAIGCGVFGGLTVLFISMAIARRAGKTVGALMMPSGATTPYQRQFSAIDALAVQGRVDEALAAYEAEVAAAPADVEVIVRTADLYMEHKRTPARAAELLRRIRTIPAAPPEKILYASHRLVDLYLGPLADRGRAIVELRVIIEKFPGSTAATFAREGLAKLKRELHEDTHGPA
ncbi:MAG: hypothetical protein HY275_03305 [Gemmatimonadetes bacterium]|nr:hypothetical protein [Gemmatimonadota bacterium]